MAFYDDETLCGLIYMGKLFRQAFVMLFALMKSCAHMVTVAEFSPSFRRNTLIAALLFASTVSASALVF